MPVEKDCVMRIAYEFEDCVANKSIPCFSQFELEGYMRVSTSVPPYL